MNRTKFLLLAFMAGLIILSCSMFEPDESLVVEEPEAYLAKMPWSEATFKFAVGDKRAFLYNNSGSEVYGQIYFDGEGKTLTFDIQNEKPTATVVDDTYDEQAQSMEYTANVSLNNYFSKGETILIELDNINKGYLTTYSVRRVTTNSIVTNYDTNGNPSVEVDADTNFNTTKYLFYWTLKLTNDVVGTNYNENTNDTDTDTDSSSIRF